MSKTHRLAVTKEEMRTILWEGMRTSKYINLNSMIVRFWEQPTSHGDNQG